MGIRVKKYRTLAYERADIESEFVMLKKAEFNLLLGISLDRINQQLKNKVTEEDLKLTSLGEDNFYYFDQFLEFVTHEEIPFAERSEVL